MNVAAQEWSANGFAVSYTGHGELVVIGPNNHLYIGCSRDFSQALSIQSVASTQDGVLQIQARSKRPFLRCSAFTQGDVRTYRSMRMQHGVVAARTMERLSTFPELKPQRTELEKQSILMSRSYARFTYEARITFPEGSRIVAQADAYTIELPKDNRVVSLYFSTNDLRAVSDVPRLRTQAVLKKRIPGLTVSEQSAIYELLDTALREIELMVKWGKTSSDRFGTVFPRDWMETADIGRAIFPQRVIDLLYEKALKHVTSTGEGWHEDVVGELRERNRREGRQIVNRDMIDIEPHYLLGLPYVSSQVLKKHHAQFQAIARRVYTMAKKRQLVTFKKITAHDRAHHDVFSRAELKGKVYLPRGNWRDIASSFGHANDAVAPFDVNAAFIPKALAYALEYGVLPRTKETTAVLEWWRSAQDLYRFSNPDGSIAFGLCRYGAQSTLLDMNHLDESYYYFYRQGTEQDLKSFAERLRDPHYLHTPVGPVVTALNNRIGLDTRAYHGTVIWPKQTAFAVLALSKHVALGKKAGWSPATIELMRSVLSDTVVASLRAYARMHTVPELYICRRSAPLSFMAQNGTSEESSSVQLWSAIALHAMLKEYLSL